MFVTFRIYACVALALASIPALAQGLSLEEALKIGESYSARLAAQRSAVMATGQQVGRAAELPDPKGAAWHREPSDYRAGPFSV